LARIVRLDFSKVWERIIFDVKSVIFGLFEREYVVINLMILLVKKYLYQQSRKNNRIAFNDILKYLHNYYTLEEKMSKSTFCKNRWSKWECLFEVS
jgi:hypothetical protein